MSDTDSVSSNSSSKSSKKLIKKKPSTNHIQNVDDIYSKMEHKEHIFKKPDTYVGSCSPEDTFAYVLVNKDGVKSIVQKQITWTPAFYKCFDELLVNCHDHKKRMEAVIESEPTGHHQVTQIKVNMNNDGSFVFYNDGDGIRIQWSDKNLMYPPQLIFANLLSSTNFDDNNEREWGGRNGYGAKLANIFSKKFIVETIDHINKKYYYQEYTDNMNTISPPIIKTSSQKPYTRITWYPDYDRFKMTGLTPDVRALLERRVCDISGISDKGLKVYLNDILMDIRSFERYVSLYDQPNTQYIQDTIMGWNVIVTASSDDAFEHVSFVNGIYTSRGGTHVEYVGDQIKKKLAKYLTDKNKKLNIKPQYILNKLKLYINATKIINPSFDSQLKDTLKSDAKSFKTKYTPSDKFITNLGKSTISQDIINFMAYKDSQALSKTDGKMSTRIKVNKLDDANNAGTNKSRECTLIITEGDSAKTMAITGLSVVGRDNYGVWPVRGKTLNVRDATTKQIGDCQVLNDLKKILGLSTGKDYMKEFEETGSWPLRYGRIMLMTDQDLDGSHIKGLIMNIFDTMWPSLKHLGFITCLVTPIVKVSKGKTTKCFYTLQDFDKWKEEELNWHTWKVKYYKGLGTSNKEETKEYFSNLKILEYYVDDINTVEQSSITIEDSDNEDIDDTSSQLSVCTTSSTSSKINKKLDDDIDIPISKQNRLDLAFNKKRADHRKEWLRNYNRNLYINYKKSRISFNEFVDNELIHFSNADNDRSIPSIMDGLKPSQRKILYAGFKRRLDSTNVDEMKVAQFAAYVADETSYHHGEVSLAMTIVGMAQNFVGSNNINLFYPSGQFGSRLQGGDDASSPRYIFTYIEPITRSLFKHSDDPICNYMNDDGKNIEPEYYYPILPTIIINGTKGIGTGFSTFVPKYNPMDVSNYVKAKIDKKSSSLKLTPWYDGFKGQIIPDMKGGYYVKGLYVVLNSTTIAITELPVNTWTEDYIEFLDDITISGKRMPKQFIKSYINKSTDENVYFEIKIDSSLLTELTNKINIKTGFNELETKLKLISNISLNNIHAFDENNKIKKFKSPEDIIDAWFDIRLGVYIKRRDYQLNELKKELDIIKYKTRFLEQIIDESLEVRNRKKSELKDELLNLGYPMIITTKKDPSYDYLLGMDIWHLTEEEIVELKKKRDMKQIEFDTLYGKTVEQIWKEDIAEFEEQYIKFKVKKDSQNTTVKDTVPIKKRVVRSKKE